MHRSPKRRRKQWRQKQPLGPSDLTRRERWKLLATAILVVIVPVVSLHFLGEWRAWQTREAWLETLATRYGVTEAQRARIREIEISYHGTGSIFTKPGHTQAELVPHRQLISEQIPADAADRFLADHDGRESLSASP